MYSTHTGCQPQGQVTSVILHRDLPGFPDDNTLQLSYIFPDGIQTVSWANTLLNILFTNNWIIVWLSINLNMQIPRNYVELLAKMRIIWRENTFGTKCFFILKKPFHLHVLSSGHYYFFTVCSVVACCWATLFFPPVGLLKTNSQHPSWYSQLWPILSLPENTPTFCHSCRLGENVGWRSSGSVAWWEWTVWGAEAQEGGQRAFLKLTLNQNMWHVDS